MKVQKNWYRLIIVVVALLTGMVLSGCSSNSDGDNKMRNMVPENVSGWQLQNASEKYDRQTIFDYIDGAGEVYLAYGFTEVSVFHFKKAKSPEIGVEIFDMSKPEDAFGVFSHARESENTGIGNGYEYRGSLLGFWQSKYYVTVLAEELTPESKEAIFAIAEYISEKLPKGGEKPKIIGYLPPTYMDRSTVRYFHLHSMLNYHYFLSEDNLLNMGTETEAALTVYQPDDVYLICIQYPTAGEATNGRQGFLRTYLPDAKDSGIAQLENGQWMAIRQVDNFNILALDAVDMKQLKSLLESCEQQLKNHLQKEEADEG